MRVLIGLLSVLIPIGVGTVAVAEPLTWPEMRGVFDWLRIGLAISGIIMMIGFIRYAIRFDAVPRERHLWVVVLLLGNIFALPFFWFWYIRQPHGS